jgi:iron complex outermembrane receptor protein
MKRGIVMQASRITNLAAASLIAFISTSAYAQIEEITVTAQKREQALTDVSISMNAFTDEDMRIFRVEDPTDIAQFVSNMDIKGTLGGVNPAITLRGVGLNDFNANNNPSVGVYIDEVFLASPAMLNSRMFDVERVEVLKGPQGTLYGRNATGGAINVVNRKPSQETDAYISVGAGDYDLAEIEGAIGGGFSDTVSGRLSASYRDQGESFHTNLLTGSDFGNMKTTALRGQLLFEPSDTFSAHISVHYAKAEGSNTPFAIFGLLDPDNPVNPDFSVNLCGPAQSFRFDNSQCSDAFGILETNDGDPYTHTYSPADAAKYIVDTDVTGAAVRLEWNLDNISVTSITGVESQDRVFGDNVNSVPYQLSQVTHNEEISQFSQEIRVTGETGGGAQWIAGVFYSSDEFEAANLFESADFFLTNLFWDNDQETTTYAVFGSVDWALSDTMTLTTGLRYTDEEIKFAGGTTDLNPFDSSCIIDPFCLPTGFGAVPITGINDKFSDDNVSGRIALEIRPNDDWLIYGSVSTGFKSGGFFGDFTFDNSELTPFNSETITSYEIGSKSTLADGKVQLNASVFYYDYDDIQTTVPGTLVIKFDNAEGAEVTGLDLDIIAVPTEGLTLGFGLGLLDTELGAIGDVAAGGSPAGGKLPNAADVQANGLIRYEFPVGSSMHLSLQGNFKYTDDMFRDAFNDRFNFSEGYTVADARVSLTSDSGGWELALWAKNLTDEEYTEQSFNFVDLSGLANQLYGPPRTYGATFTYFLAQ